MVAVLGLVVLLTPVGGLGQQLIIGRHQQHPVFFGLDVPNNDPALWDDAVRASGVPPTVANIFVKLDSPSFSLSTLTSIHARGLIPMVTVEPWSYHSRWGQTSSPQYSLRSIAEGDHDAALRHLAEVVASYHGLVYVRFAQEMNGWWYPWAESQNDNAAGDYVRAWRHVITLWRQSGASGARFIWSPNALSGSERAASLAELYPGDAYVDYLGMTAYGHTASATTSLDATLHALASLSRRPVILSEVGADGDDRAKWITSLGLYMAGHPAVIGFVWYNTTPATTGATGDYRFDATPGSARSFRSMLRQVSLTAPHQR